MKSKMAYFGVTVAATLLLLMVSMAVPEYDEFFEIRKEAVESIGVTSSGSFLVRTSAYDYEFSPTKPVPKAAEQLFNDGAVQGVCPPWRMFIGQIQVNPVSDTATLTISLRFGGYDSAQQEVKSILSWRCRKQLRSLGFVDSNDGFDGPITPTLYMDWMEKDMSGQRLPAQSVKGAQTILVSATSYPYHLSTVDVEIQDHKKLAGNIRKNRLLAPLHAVQNWVVGFLYVFA